MYRAGNARLGGALLAAKYSPCPAFVAWPLRGSVLLGGATGANGAVVRSVAVIVVLVFVDPA